MPKRAAAKKPRAQETTDWTDDDWFEVYDSALTHAIAYAEIDPPKDLKTLFNNAIHFTHFLQTGEMPPELEGKIVLVTSKGQKNGDSTGN